MSDDLDDVDKQILHLLQEDARNNTNAEIGERVGVSPSTVSNRLSQLEADGIIQGYQPTIDYGSAKFPLHVLFICTVPIPDRNTLACEALELPGVVNVRELMTGRHNIQIQAVARDNERITALATAIDDLGIDIDEELLVKGEYPRPANVFEPERPATR